MKADGQAFPGEDQEWFYLGISVRDYIAIKAMQGIIACGAMEAANKAGVDPATNDAACAHSAYKIADAMIAESNKGDA